MPGLEVITDEASKEEFFLIKPGLIQPAILSYFCPLLG